MIAVLEQIGFLAFFFLAGFLLSRANLIKQEHSKLLSTLILWLFLPATIIRSFVKNFTIENLSTYYVLILVSLAILVVNIALSFLYGKIFTRGGYTKNVYRYSAIVPNANVGYGFAEGMTGTEGLLRFTIFNIPVIFFCYTFGYALLTKQKFTFKRLLNPVTAALAIGIVLGLLPIEMPAFVSTLLDKTAACMVPVCMITVGIGISEFRFFSLFKNWRAIVFTLLRLVALPVVLRFTLSLFLPPEIVIPCVLFYSMPC